MLARGIRASALSPEAIVNDRSGPTHAHGMHRFMLAVLSALVVMGLCSTALAQGRGALVILGLRAPDGDDEAAANATAALRRAARNAGFEVPNDSPALEQSMASFGCDDSLPPTCLSQIAGDLHATRMIYGQVRRHGRGRDAVLSIQVSMFETASSNTTGHDQVEVPRAMAQDSDSLTHSAARLIGTIAPAPTAQNNAVVASSAPPPVVPSGPPAPVRRYVSFGLIGVGGALVITGAVLGALWGILPNPEWEAYNIPPSAWGNYPGAASLPDGNPNNSGVYVCDYARTNSQRIYQNFCTGASTYSTAGWALGGVGVGLLVTGVILLVTDHPSSEHASRGTRPRFGFMPTFNPEFQGATVAGTF